VKLATVSMTRCSNGSTKARRAKTDAAARRAARSTKNRLFTMIPLKGELLPEQPRPHWRCPDEKGLWDFSGFRQDGQDVPVLWGGKTARRPDRRRVGRARVPSYIFIDVHNSIARHLCVTSKVIREPSEGWRRRGRSRASSNQRNGLPVRRVAGPVALWMRPGSPRPRGRAGPFCRRAGFGLWRW
jgi:hypothetical protein